METGGDSRKLVKFVEFLKYDMTFLLEAGAASLAILKHFVSGHYLKVTILAGT